MGVAAGEGVKQVAFVKCAGDCEKAKQDYEYTGVEDCAAMLIYFHLELFPENSQEKAKENTSSAHHQGGNDNCCYIHVLSLLYHA